MYIKLEEGQDTRIISLVDGAEETYFVSADGDDWERGAVGTEESSSYTNCRVCTIEELWQALRKVAGGKVWTPA